MSPAPTQANVQGMEDVTADGYDDGVDNVELDCMVDEWVGESQIDRDEAVHRLGAFLQRQPKRPRIRGKQAAENSETSGEQCSFPVTALWR